MSISPRDKALAAAEDRQRVLNEVCRRVLSSFVGRKVTPMLMAEAEATLRRALDDAVRFGKYVLPDGLELDRIVLGTDMRIKVMFKTALGVKLSENAVKVLQKPWDLDVDDPEPAPKNRFEAVVAEINSQEKL